MSHASASFKPCLMDEPAIIGRGHEQRKKTDQDQQPNKKKKRLFKSMLLHSIEQNCIIHKTKYGQSFLKRALKMNKN